MSGTLGDVYAHIDDQSEAYVEELRTFLRQPSISAQEVGLEACADLLADLMVEAGIETEVHEVEGAGPIVVGQVRPRGAEKTLVCYGHYDVQPPEPLELWTSEPFSAEVREGKIYARGATDDKGSLFETVKAVEAYQAVRGELPVNLVMVFEGEEEIGSSQFGGWVAEHLDLFEDADGMYGLDGNCDRFSGHPRMFMWGQAEIIYVELRVKTGKKDIWAGEASLVPNAAWRLVWALSTLKDPDERIQIEGWYDNLVPASQEEVELYASLPFDEGAAQEYFGLDELLLGREGGEVHRARYHDPTCTIAGIHSGYGGPGSKTIVPSEAVAKVDFRLLPNQDPQRLFGLLTSHLERNGFGDIEVVSLPADARPSPFREVKPQPTWREADVVKAMKSAAREFFASKPIVIGGSREKPTGPTLLDRHGPECLPLLGNGALTALGIPDARGWMGDRDSNLHAPDEFISTEAFIRGTKIAARLMNEFAL